MKSVQRITAEDESGNKTGVSVAQLQEMLDKLPVGSNAKVYAWSYVSFSDKPSLKKIVIEVSE